MEIFELFTGKSHPEIEAHFEGKGYTVLKGEVAEVVVEGLRPVRERYQELMSDPVEFDALMAIGAERARSVADQTE